MTKEFPSVCICVPTYNAEATIREMLSSALAQSYPNFTIRILDNASTDRTVEIVESFDDRRISIFRSDANIGAVANFDRCIELAMGKYTEMFHSDEVYEPDMLMRQVEVLEANPDVGVVFTEAYLINERSEVFGETSVARYINAPSGSIAIRDYEALIPALYRAGNFLLCSGAMVRTDVYQKEIRRWRSDLFASSCDLDVWIRIAERHAIGFVLDKLMRTRSSRTQASYSEIKRNVNRADMYLVLDHYLELPRTRRALTAADMSGYAAMQRMDRARRGMNLYLLGRVPEANAVLSENFEWGLLAYAHRSRRGLLTFMLTIYLKIVISIGADRIGRAIMRHAEKKMSV